ncbi:site-2 protease family protein [Candidatus Micrarchaeota archaeon]|nr:site-2 protease family protein [Candidatus Micrarchaeota archaeon]
MRIWLYFTGEEVKEIVFSVLSIALALSLALSGDDIGSRLMPDPHTFAYNFALILLVIAPAFVLHEMAHKFVAIHYGCRARFKAWWFGIGLMFVFAIGMGFVFAAPGAVYIFAPYLTRRENGIISASGPLTNIALSIISLALLIGMITAGVTEGFWFQAAQFSTLINAFLAGFNMVPMYPLDGSKVMYWNIKVWLAILITALAILFITVPEAATFVLSLVVFGLLLQLLFSRTRILI